MSFPHSTSLNCEEQRFKFHVATSATSAPNPGPFAPTSNLNHRITMAAQLGSSSRNGTRDLSHQILDRLEHQSSIDTSAAFPDIPQHEIKAALDRLQSRLMVQYTTHDTEQILLTDEGQLICDQGSHEYRVWEAVQKLGKLEIKDLAVGQLSIRQLRDGP